MSGDELLRALATLANVRSGSVKRVASAVGEGSIAIRFVGLHLGRRRAGLVPAQPAPVS